MGRPANTPFSPRALAHSGKAVATLFENLALIRLARPGLRSLSWARTGIPQPGGHHHRHRHKAALGKNDVRLDLSQQMKGLEGPGDHPERVSQVLPVKIAAQLARWMG